LEENVENSDIGLIDKITLTLIRKMFICVRVAALPAAQKALAGHMQPTGRSLATLSYDKWC